MSALAMLGMVAVLVFIVFVGFSLPAQGDNEAARAGFRVGRTLAALFLPGVIAYAIAGRKKARKPNQFAAIFCGLGLLFTVANALKSGAFSGSLESPEEHVGRLMREASGLQPVHDAFLPSTRRFDDALRDQFRNLIRVNREYSETVKNADISEIKKINSPESFADPDYAAPALQQLHAVYAIDATQEEKVKEILGNLRHTMENEISSSSDRESFLRGFDASVNAQLATRRQAVAAEKGWVDSVDDEYAYAAEHLRDLRLNAGHLVIADEAIRQEFNTRLQAQAEKRKDFIKAQEDFSKFQAQLLQKMGVSPKDIGAGK